MAVEVYDAEATYKIGSVLVGCGGDIPDVGFLGVGTVTTGSESLDEYV